MSGLFSANAAKTYKLERLSAQNNRFFCPPVFAQKLCRPSKRFIAILPRNV